MANITTNSIDQLANYTPTAPVAVQPAAGAGQVVQGNLDSLLSADNSYIQNARTQGLEQAASRGLRNSSIAAGNSQRAAIEASMPILNQIMGLNNQREQQAYAAEQAGFDRDLAAATNSANIEQSTNTQLRAADIAQRQAAQDYQYRSWLQGDQVKQQDWLNSQQFTRQFNAELAMLPVKTANDLSAYIAQYAIQNPQVYSQNAISGMQNFFTGSFLSTMRQYFPNLVSGG